MNRERKAKETKKRSQVGVRTGPDWPLLVPGTKVKCFACMFSFRDWKGGRHHRERRISSRHTRPGSTLLHFICPVPPVLWSPAQRALLSWSFCAVCISFGIIRHLVHFIHQPTNVYSTVLELVVFNDIILLLSSGLKFIHSEDLGSSM